MSILDFERSRDRILKQIDVGSESAIRRALALLNDLRQEVINQIRAAGNLESDVFRMRLVQNNIEAAIRQFEGELMVLVRTETRAQFEKGVQLVDAPLGTLDIASITGISREVVLTAEQFSADLIQGITGDIRNKINSILKRAVLGGLTFQQAQNEIGRSLTSRGAFSSIANRAEAILRTELLRVQSQSTQIRMEQQAKQVTAAGYELGKYWLATLDLRTRMSHRIAGIKYNALNAIGVEEPFVVDGENLMYPRDPAGSASNTIQCRCSSVPSIQKIAVQRAA